MYRLAEGGFPGEAKLNELALYCLTETIKTNLEVYFLAGYQSESEENLYKKVIVEDVIELLLPDELINDMDSAGIDVPVFIAKKIAQFMLLLQNPEPITPDIFIEYLLYYMVEVHKDLKIDGIVQYVSENAMKKKGELKQALFEYFKDDYEGIDLNIVVEEMLLLLTDFSSILGIDDLDDSSLVIWDTDFTFFDTWGFTQTIQQLGYGVLATMGGYGLEYTKEIFTSVGEKVPNVLQVS